MTGGSFMRIDRRAIPEGDGSTRKVCARALLIWAPFVRLALNLSSDLFQKFFQASAAKSACRAQSFSYDSGSVCSVISDDLFGFAFHGFSYHFHLNGGREFTHDRQSPSAIFLMVRG